MIKKALYWKKDGERIHCLLCPHNCLIAEGKSGICSVRVNKEGVLQTINYGEIATLSLDPVEKKPFYHYKPGKKILSAGTFGCNFSCRFCQNHTISQNHCRTEFMLPEHLAAGSTVSDDNIGIAFTYNEPTIWYEYILDTAKTLKEAFPEMSVILITNGYIETEPLAELLPFVDALNIDLKSMGGQFYRRLCGGEIKPVLRTIEAAYRKCHLEITALLINGLNDSEEEIERLASYLSGLDENIPLHLSRYFPAYRMTRPPTDIDVMKKAKDIAGKYLNYIYLGNMPQQDNSTYCHVCNELLVQRTAYFVRSLINQAICPKCGAHVRIVF
ncbi:MAG TPA: AmmeMemoRadiSam system radical SAM enzyme [Clostridiales bacterium]|nr:AmmeMemoRadiSam system radical SAM enzyme [Clostridiales bacterium]